MIHICSFIEILILNLNHFLHSEYSVILKTDILAAWYILACLNLRRSASLCSFTRCTEKSTLSSLFSWIFTSLVRLWVWQFKKSRKKKKGLWKAQNVNARYSNVLSDASNLDNICNLLNLCHKQGAVSVSEVMHKLLSHNCHMV